MVPDGNGSEVYQQCGSDCGDFIIRNEEEDDF
jgi:hypothetical protein